MGRTQSSTVQIPEATAASDTSGYEPDDTRPSGYPDVPPRPLLLGTTRDSGDARAFPSSLIPADPQAFVIIL